MNLSRRWKRRKKGATLTPIIDKALLTKSSACRGSSGLISGGVHYLETNTLCFIKSIHIAPMSTINGRFSETRYFLSPEIREKICQRRVMGRTAVHSVLLEAPFCENREQIAKVVMCKPMQRLRPKRTMCLLF